MVMVTAKLESAREGDGIESGEKEQEQWDGEGDTEARAKEENE